MPPHNHFRHQRYTATTPRADYELLSAHAPSESESDEFNSRMKQFGRILRKERVVALYLVHGTFTGSDAWGLFRQIARLAPALRKRMQQQAKQLVDILAQDHGNYTQRYATEMERAINGGGATPIPVRRFTWTGENHHLGRADCAVRLIDELQTRFASSQGRVLFWGHSHAGNAFALMTNLLAADPTPRRRFFRAVRGFFLGVDTNEAATWRRVRKLLRPAGNPLQNIRVDFATFGTPIRYGWDTDGYGQLLHFTFHRPVAGIPDHLAPFPLTFEQVYEASGGDVIQQLGIAGTNLQPHLLNFGAWLANRRLGRILQSGVRSRDLLSHLHAGMRVATEGTSLLVDYGLPLEHAGRHLLGHAVYTQREWMLFHAEQIAKRMYDANG